MIEYPWRPLGELLVRRGLIDEYQLESLLLEQKLSGQLFGELLVAKRIVSPIDMAAVIAEQHGLHLTRRRRPAPVKAANRAGGRAREWRPLGRILVERDLLTESGLQRVLLAQRRRGCLLGRLLLERGYVTPAQLASALAEQHGLDLAPEELTDATSEPAEPEMETHYEVRSPGQPRDVLHASPSFLDASDFAFELLYDEDPDELEIVAVDGHRRSVTWSYARPAAA